MRGVCVWGCQAPLAEVLPDDTQPPPPDPVLAVALDAFPVFDPAPADAHPPEPAVPADPAPPTPPPPPQASVTDAPEMVDVQPDPPLPAVVPGTAQVAYAYYDRNWRPGRKRPQDWPASWAAAMEVVGTRGTASIGASEASDLEARVRRLEQKIAVLLTSREGETPQP